MLWSAWWNPRDFDEAWQGDDDVVINNSVLEYNESTEWLINFFLEGRTMTTTDLRRDVSFVNADFDVAVSVTGPGFDLYDQDGNMIGSFETANELMWFVETN